MDIFTRHDLHALIQAEARPCVSLYMPTHRAGRDVREDPIRCKNLLTRAEELLTADGMPATAARELLAPARELHDEAHYDFWQNQSDGLALFVAPGQFRYWRVPLPLDESVTVGNRFYIKPVLPLIEGNGRFYILAVSQNHVRLLQATRFSVSELEPAHLPKNMAEALNIDEFVEALQYQGFRAGGGGDDMQAMYHGQGGSDLSTRKRDELREYFHRLDNALQEFFTDESTPLVFAGVDYLFPIFRETNHYRHLLDTPVTGNPDQLSPAELHAQAWQVVGPEFQKAQRAALERYGDRQARNLASDDLQEVIAAAREGAVETLFLRAGQSVWGTIDDATGAIHEQDEPTDDSRELLDYAAEHTLLNSGTVYLLDPPEMPSSHTAAALLRYPITWPVRAS